MRTLFDLQSSVHGRRLLEDEMVFQDIEAFISHLQPPRVADVCGDTGDGQNLKVFTHQQVYLDYQSSVVAKVVSLQKLRQCCARLQADFLWIDTDRSGSDKLGLRLYLHANGTRVPVRLAPAGCERREPRFIGMDRDRLTAGLNRMKRIVSQQPDNRNARLARLEQLCSSLPHDTTLAAFSRQLTDILFCEVLQFQPREVLVSGLVKRHRLRPVIETILNRQREFVDVFNARIRHLQSLDIDAKVKPLPGDYLPLFMTCPEDGTRLRLRLKQVDSMCFACATSRSGTSHRFELGRGTLTMDMLDRNASWSPDVTLPIMVNDSYSGMVAGKSSALYMLVFTDVMRRVLDMVPVPILVPTDWHPLPERCESLLNAYLDGYHLPSGDPKEVT